MFYTFLTDWAWQRGPWWDLISKRLSTILMHGIDSPLKSNYNIFLICNFFIQGPGIGLDLALGPHINLLNFLTNATFLSETHSL